jgi:hypothetical protein
MNCEVVDDPALRPQLAGMDGADLRLGAVGEGLRTVRREAPHRIRTRDLIYQVVLQLLLTSLQPRARRD